MAQVYRKDYYTVAGINVDVNPYLVKDAEMIECRNFYSHRQFAKKVRFGYKNLAASTSVNPGPVRNLIYFDFPNGQRGILKISDKNVYRYDFATGTFGPSIHTFKVDVNTANIVFAGKSAYVHMSNGTDYYTVYDGLTFTTFVDDGTSPPAPFTPKPTILTVFNSRIYGDINRQRLAGSAVGFDYNPTYATDPFKYNGDPTQPNAGTADSGLSQGVDAGLHGRLVGFSQTFGSMYIYKESGVYRYVNFGTIPMNYTGPVIPHTIATQEKGAMTYFLSSDSIMRNDGRNILTASNGINNIIKDTARKLGIMNPHAFAWGDYTFFYIGSIQIGNEVVPNGMFVHDERYDEWYIWQLGHNMTTFGSYYDIATNESRLISGDDEGNTYVWGEEFSTDAGLSIPYKLRTKFYELDKPEAPKQAHRLFTSTAADTGATISVAKNQEEDYKPVRGDRGGGTTGFLDVKSLNRFRSYSLEISGDTQDSRPEYYGNTMLYMDLDETKN